MCRSVLCGASDFFERVNYKMKKFLVSLLICTFLLTASLFAASAAELILYAPADAESEIMPGRDFYVVGKIDRGAQSTSTLPLNVRIELIDSKGNIVRTAESNVTTNGTTAAEYVYFDYEHGTLLNGPNNMALNLFTPPDILFDSIERHSIQRPQNKVVVKEDYFAAVIYGGASKDFELSYYDEDMKPLNDIAEGKYTLRVTAKLLDGTEVCRIEKMLTFANTKGRIVASDNSLILDYALENDLTVNSSIAGNWTPADFFTAPKDFSYLVAKRFTDNTNQEYGNAKSVSIMLYNIENDNLPLKHKLESSFKSASEKTYLYFDIGEPFVNFTFNGASLTKKGTIVETKESAFVKILRSETTDGVNKYPDFNSADGFVLTKDVNTSFYGIFSPMFSTVKSGDESNIVSKVSHIGYNITDKDGKSLRSGYTVPYIKRGDESDFTMSRYEFHFELSPDNALTNEDELYMTLTLCDEDKEVLYSGDAITLKVNKRGDFISGYSDNYWGKSFCDTINSLGQNPAGVSLLPDDHITRGDFAAMINRLFGFSITTENSFADLDAESIYYADCLTASATGYMTGDNHGNVKADDLISREEAMIILARISKAEAGNKSVIFKDSDDISFWAKDYVDIMASNGIVSGYNGYLNPKNNITVAEATALIIKTFKWMHEGEIKNSDTTTGDKSEDLSGVEITDTDFLGNIDYDSVAAFLKANTDVFSPLTNHIMLRYTDGIYISRVGNGLEVRDYLMGNTITLPEDILSITTTLSTKFAEFSIRYNPKSESAVHYVLGRGEDGKLRGLTYTELSEVKNKTLIHIEGNWYYYVQK